MGKFVYFLAIFSIHISTNIKGGGGGGEGFRPFTLEKMISS